MQQHDLPPQTKKQDHLTAVFLWFLVLLAVTSAIWAGSSFHAAKSDADQEQGSGVNIEYIVRYRDVELFSARTEMTVPETLTFLKEHGVTTIGVFEYALWTLRREANAHVLSNLELAGELSFNTDLAQYSDFLRETARAEGLRLGDYLVFVPAGPWAEQIWDHLGQLSAVEDAAQLRLKRFNYADMELFLIQGARYDYLPQLALGANPTQLANVSAAGLRVSPYLSARQIETSSSFEQALATYDNASLSPVLFEGGLVPGFPRYTAETAAALNKRNLSAIVYEYHSFPNGMKELSPLLGYNLTVMIPERSLFPSEYDVLNGVRERYVRAVELQIRHLSPGLRGDDLKASFSRQMLSLQSGLLSEHGITAGELQPLLPSPLPRVAYLLMALGLAAFTLLFLLIFIPVKPMLLLLLIVPGIALIYLLFSFNQVLTGQLLALWTAILFPAYPFLTFLQAKGKNSATGTEQQGAAFLGRAALQLSALFVFALAGGILLHGFLTMPPFLSGLEFFRGVKVMYILPLLIVGLIVIFIAPKARSSGSTLLLPDGVLGSAVSAKIGPLLRRPLTLGDLMLLGIILVVAFIYLTRTGHVLSINPVESQTRDFLEAALGVRPRFKEFLLGYPAVLIGLYWGGLLSGKAAHDFLSRILLTAGAIAPISVINTFAHIQAPLALSTLRSLHGFWLGLLCAFLVLLLLRICSRIKEKN